MKITNQINNLGFNIGLLSYNIASANLKGFQGQEMDDEIKGKGNSVNYKYRMHDTRLGRFFIVDPLGVKYPHNSPYAFSENRVNDAIELEGLEAFFIHGMSSEPGDWKKKGFKEVATAVLKLANYESENRKFDWSGKGNGFLQTRGDRIIAAEALVTFVLENKKEGEEVTLIGASHGGNVAIIAAKMLGDKGYKVNIITFNRTSFNEEGDLENPAGNKGINDIIDIRIKNDKASKFVRGGKPTNEYNGPGQSLVITNAKKFFLFRHATKNADASQIEDAIENKDLVPLKPVPEELNPPAPVSVPSVPH